MPKNCDSDYDTCSFCGKKYLWWKSPMLKNELWERISNEDFDDDGKWLEQYMCLECMEKALGRKIQECDLMLQDDAGRPCHVWWNERFVKKHFKRKVYPFFMELNGELIRAHLEQFNGGKIK